MYVRTFICNVMYVCMYTYKHHLPEETYVPLDIRTNSRFLRYKRKSIFYTLFLLTCVRNWNFRTVHHHNTS